MTATETDPRVEPFLDQTLDKADRRALLSEMFREVRTMVDAIDVTAGWLAELHTGVDHEVDLLGRIMRDVARHDQADSRKFGPKSPALDHRRTREMLRQIAGDDHTVLPFADAFRILVADRSYRHVASLTGLSKDKVSRLLHGRTPTSPEIEQVSRGFKKHPSFFREYRDSHLVGQLRQRLDDLPESSIDLYRQSTAR